MIVKKYAYRTLLIGLSGLLGFGLSVPSALASSAHSSVVTGAREDQSTLRQGLPGRRLGGGTRSDRVFAERYAYLAALVTSDNLNQTAKEKPTLLFAVPEMLSAHEAEFILRDREGEEVYRTTFMLDGSAGIISLDLSQTNAAALQVGNDYRWYFSIMPGQSKSHRADDIVVHGNIRRVQGDTQPVASTATLSVEDRATQARALYEGANRWHDAAVVLNSLRADYPDNPTVAAEWDRLVAFAGLSAVLPSTAEVVEVSLKSN